MSDRSIVCSGDCIRRWILVRGRVPARSTHFLCQNPDVLVLPHGPIAHPGSRSMTSPSPSVTVMIRPAADVVMRPAPEMGVRWPKQARHTSQLDRFRMRGEELAVEAPARPSGRDGVMASPPQPRRRWLLEGAGAAFQHVLTASTVTYDQSERTVPYSTPTSLG